MPLNDDDDLELSYSSDKRFTRSADQARKEELEKKLKAPVAKDVSKLKLSMLKQQVKNEGQKDDQTKQDQERKSQTFGTKSREQEIKQSTLDANTDINPDQMVQQGEVQQKAKDEQQKSGEVQSQPA